MLFVQVTGGSSGIGKSVAVQAAEKGANVTIIARSLEKLKEAKEEIKNARISEQQKVICIASEFIFILWSS